MPNAVKAQFTASHNTYRVPSRESVVIETRITEGPASFLNRECHVEFTYSEAETLIESLARWLSVPVGKTFQSGGTRSAPDYLRMLADAIEADNDEQVYKQFAGPVA